MERRPYGKDGDLISVLAFGGIIVVGMEQDRANRTVAEAVERGINYFDVAPTYGDGEAEEKLGPALEPFRKDCFLACKTAERTLDGAKKDFWRSLERMRTDHFDLYQLHAITRVEHDVVQVFDEGIMDFLIEQKKEGRIRHLGFSAHSTEAAFEALDRYPFESALFPLNFATWKNGNFGPALVERARREGVTLLALKPGAKQKWPSSSHPDRQRFSKCWYQPLDDPEMIRQSFRWTLGIPVTAMVPPGEEWLYRKALDAAPTLTPLSEAESEDLMAKAEGLEPLFRCPMG